MVVPKRNHLGRYLLFLFLSLGLVLIGFAVYVYRNVQTTGKPLAKVPVFIPKAESNPDLSQIKLMDGFAIDYFAQGVEGARSLSMGEKGIVFVGSREAGKVYALVDENEDGKAEKTVVIASGLTEPNGVDYYQGDLFVAERTRVIVFEKIEEQMNASKFEYRVIYSGLPKETHHGWRYLRVGPDGKLYIGIGAPCNVCLVSDPYGSIARMNRDGSGFEVIARGVRNSVGFDWDSEGRLWFTDNGRDWLGDDKPDDEMNRVDSVGENFGFPHCFGMDVVDPDFPGNCADYKAPEWGFGAHVASLGMRFYNGKMLGDLAGKIVVAEHGSWNRTVPVGYRVVVFDPVAEDEVVLAQGWLDGSRVYGRPVDVEEYFDGSILVSDDKAGAVYRIFR